jgi:hypothetical protein
LYAATWTEYLLPAGAAVAVFGIVSTGTEASTRFTTGDEGDGTGVGDVAGDGEITLAGTLSTDLTSLPTLPPGLGRVTGLAVAVEERVVAGDAESPIGDFNEATDTAIGQR